jgi:hypothetical protein
MKFFSDYLQGLPKGTKLVVRVNKISEQKTSKNGKAFWSISFEIVSTRDIMSGALWKNDLKFYLNNVLPSEGEMLTVWDEFRDGYHNTHYKRGDTEVNNSKSVAGEQVVTERIREERKSDDEVTIHKIVCNYIAAGISAGKTPTEAGRMAVEAYKVQNRMVKDILALRNAPEIIKEMDEELVEQAEADKLDAQDTSDLPF